MRAAVFFLLLLSSGADAMSAKSRAPKPKVALATCKMVADCGRENCVTGRLIFKQKSKGGSTAIRGVLSGVLPLGKHGWHVHEFPIRNKTEGCGSTGGHFNPKGVVHGSPEGSRRRRHFGDLGNIESFGKRGKVNVRYTDKIVGLVGRSDLSAIGRALVIHELEDDLGLGEGEALDGSRATGNAGARIGCCEIKWRINPDE